MIRFLKNHWYFLTLPLVLGACGNSDQDHSPQGFKNVRPTQPPTELERALLEAPFSCERPEVCVNNIGMMAIQDTNDQLNVQNKVRSQCTGFLISDHVIATAAHCIPRDLGVGSNCSERIAIRFQDTSIDPRSTYACRNILQRSPLSDVSSKESGINQNQQDYAYFEIDSTPRPPVIKSDAGIPDNFQAQAIGVRPLGSDALGGTLIALMGTSNQASLLNSMYTSTYSPVAVFLGMDTIPGMSGSPIFARTTGEWIGILQSGITRDKWPILFTALHQSFDLPTEDVKPTFATNAACLPSPQGVSSKNIGLCLAESEKKNTSPLFASDNPQIQRALTALVMKWIGDFPSLAFYKLNWPQGSSNLRDSNVILSVTATPYCLRSKEHWSKEILQKKTTPSGLLASEQYRVPYYGKLELKVRPVLDNKYHIRKDTQLVSEESEVSLDITIDLFNNITASMIEKSEVNLTSLLGLVGSALPYERVNVDVPWYLSPWSDQILDSTRALSGWTTTHLPDLRWCTEEEETKESLESAAQKIKSSQGN